MCADAQSAGTVLPRSCRNRCAPFHRPGIAREARGEGKYRRRFEVLRLDTLAIETQASDASALRAFQRWQDPSWKRETLAPR